MSLSHDIRTPLTSLTGYFQLLNDCDKEEDKVRYRQVIDGRITSLKNILEELFTYAKLQDENYVIDSVEINLSKLICDTLFGFYEDFKVAKLEPVVEIDDGISILANEDAVVRIIQNLIKNALLHSLSRVQIGMKLSSSNEGQVEICVSNDTSKPEDIVIEKVFERFYKADSDRSKGSTGLGLSIVKGLSEKMGGSARAKLIGNTFSIVVSLPKKQ